MISEVQNASQFERVLRDSGYLGLLKLSDEQMQQKEKAFSDNFNNNFGKNLGYYKDESLQTVLSISNLYKDTMVAHSLASVTRYELKSKIFLYNELFRRGEVEGEKFFISWYEKDHSWHKRIFSPFNQSEYGSKKSIIKNYEMFAYTLDSVKNVIAPENDMFDYVEVSGRKTNDIEELATGKIAEFGKRTMVKVFDSNKEFVATAEMENFPDGINYLNFFNMIKLHKIRIMNKQMIVSLLRFLSFIYFKKMDKLPSYIIFGENAVKDELTSLNTDGLVTYENPITLFVMDAREGLEETKKRIMEVFSIFNISK